MVTYNVINRGLDFFDYVDDMCCETEEDFIHTEYPYVHVYEGNNEIEVRAAIPGITREKLNIEIKDELLIIEGEKTSDYAGHDYLRKERTFGKFRKSINLPYEVDAGKVNAELKDGMLTLKMPKSELAKPKKIEIK